MQQFFGMFLLGAVVAFVVATLIAGAIGRSGFPLPPDDRRLGCVDGLRGYLAMAVLIHHFFVWIDATRLGGSWVPPTINLLNQLGAGSVALFFMTTGLVFYRRILARPAWIGLYVTRMFRIVPLVMASVILVTIVIMARTGAVPDRGYSFAAETWISTWNEPPLLGYVDSGRINAWVLWSLWYEWQFYLFILPACSFAMVGIRKLDLPTWTLPVMLLGIGIAARIVASVTHWPIGVLYYVPLFAVGMLAYELQSRPAVRAALSTPRMAIAAGGALLIGMVATHTPYALSLPVFGFFFVCVACGNDLRGVLRGRGALVLGECSFGIYLLHGIVLDILFVDARAFLGQFPLAALPLFLPVAAAVVVVLTAATYLLIERPAMRFGRGLSDRLAGRWVGLDSRELEVAP